MTGAPELWLALFLFVMSILVSEWAFARRTARLVRWEERLIAWQAEVQALGKEVEAAAVESEAHISAARAQVERESEALREAAALISYGAHQEAIEVLEACPGIDVSVNGQRRTA